jgi:hypothetical protein
LQEKDDSTLLDEYETELRRRLATQTAATTTRDDAIDVFESLLKESMDDVATLMREVQQELNQIRAEEKRFKSLSMQSLLGLQLSRSSAPILDTLSIDGQLPFCSLTAGGHSTAHLPFESLSIASMMTSSEVSSVAPPRACALTPDPMNANFCPFLFDWRLFCERGFPAFRLPLPSNPLSARRTAALRSRASRRPSRR